MIKRNRIASMLVLIIGFVFSPLSAFVYADEVSVVEQVDSTPTLLTPSSGPTLPFLSTTNDSKLATGAAVGEEAMGRMVVGLLVVLAIIYGASWVLKRLNVNKFGLGNALSVTGVLSIGAKEKVVVVDVEGTRLVLGVTANTITNLHTLESLPTSVKVDSIPLPLMKKKTPSDFAKQMQKILKEGMKSE